jgi:long-chain acyl-CoA synthetase
VSAPRGVFDVLDAAVAADPNREAVVCRSGRLSYAELDRLADMAAGALFALGVRPGDRVAVSWPNDLDIVVAFHGAMRLGAIWVGVARVLAPPEKAYLVSDSGASLVLGDEQMEEWRAALDASPGRPDVAPPDPLEPAAIAYTSGTTGFPKGAVHCQAGLVLPGAATVARRGWGPELRKGDSFALTILNMHCLTTLLTAQAGATAVIMDRGDVASVVEWVRREGVTVWNGAPAHLYSMVADESIDPIDLASLKEVWVGGGDCPDRLKRAFEERFGIPVTRTYGLTEAPSLVSLDDLPAASDTGIASPAPAGTSGRPLDHIKVQSVEGEVVLAPASPGSYIPMLGYWNQPEATAEALDSHGLHTGDLGEVTAAGHLRVLGRKSALIIRGGANVYPAEVERVLAEAPGVSACAVVGIPDERLGERVGAAVELRPGATPDEEAILAYCRQALASYKVPEKLVFVQALPRNQMGKVPQAEVVALLEKAPTGS